MQKTKKPIRQTAMDLLARREHCEQELQQKLRQRRFEQAEIDDVLQALRAENLLSDVRYVEAYVHQRGQKGYGPLRIAAELQERGIKQALIDEFVDADSQHWLAIIANVKQKKFGTTMAMDFQEKAKQMRFLQYRGFTNKQIQSVVDD